MKSYTKHIITLILTTVSILGLSGCLKNRVINDPDYDVPDILRPDVIHNVPKNGSEYVDLNTQIIVWFDEVIDELTVEPALYYRPKIDIDEVSCVAYDPYTDGRVYAACTDRGIFRSDDNGEIWSWISRYTFRKTVNTMIFDGTNDQIWATNNDGILKSSNAGVSWNYMNNGLTTTSINVLTIDPTNPSILYAGADNGIFFKSVDSGENWVETGVGLPGNPIYSIAVNSENSQILLVNSTENYIFRSEDSGATFSRNRSGLSTREFYSLVFHSTQTNIAYAGGITAGMYKSSDYGNSWENITNNLGNKNIRAIYPNIIDTNSIIVQCTNEMYQTTDAGNTWTNISGAWTELALVSSDVKGLDVIAGFSSDITVMNASSDWESKTTIDMDELSISGLLDFEIWSDTLTIVSLLDSALFDTLDNYAVYDTTTITPYVNPRALEAWEPGTEAPVDIHPDATKLTFTMTSETELIPEWEYQVTFEGRFESSNVEVIKPDAVPVKDINGNSMEKDHNFAFITKAKSE